MATDSAGGGGNALTPPPVLCRVEVRVYPVCPHTPKHELDEQQQLHFIQEIQPAVHAAVEWVSRRMVSSVGLQPKLMSSVGTQTLPITLPNDALPPMTPSQCDTSNLVSPISFTSPLATSTPDKQSHPILRQLLTQPERNYLKDVETITPPISPDLDGPQPECSSSPLTSDHDPVMPMWSPTKFPPSTSKADALSVYSGSDTDRGIPETQDTCLESGCLMDTPPLPSSDHHIQSQESLALFTSDDIAQSLDPWSSSFDESQIDWDMLEPLYDMV